MRHIKLKRAREQLDETLQIFTEMASVARPIRGWIRAIRDALGMNMRQLADRLGVGQSWIVKIEQDELSGALTIKTLEKIADKLDCVFVYGFVPRSTIENTVRNQAVCVALERLNMISHHLYFEAQELTKHHSKAAFESMVEEILESPSKLWDKKFKSLNRSWSVFPCSITDHTRVCGTKYFLAISGIQDPALKSWRILLKRPSFFRCKLCKSFSLRLIQVVLNRCFLNIWGNVG